MVAHPCNLVIVNPTEAPDNARQYSIIERHGRFYFRPFILTIFEGKSEVKTVQCVALYRILSTQLGVEQLMMGPPDLVLSL